MNLLTLYGEDHTQQYRQVINGLIRKQHERKPLAYLALEELGPYSYFTKEEKIDAIKREDYSVGPQGLELAIELGIPAIGIDLWGVDIYKEDKFDSNDFAIDVTRSFKLREGNMLNVLKRYHRQGNGAAIVGDTHLRKTKTKQLGQSSPLYIHFNGLRGVEIVRCPNRELD